MSPAFTDDDIGKTVETATGEILGVVADIDPETAYVEPAEGVTDSTRAVLDWERDAVESVPLTDDVVDRITDEAVQLEAEFEAESITTGTTADGESDELEPGEQDVEYAPGESVTSNPTEPESDVDGTASGPETDDLEESEPMLEDDEFYDAAEGGARVDPDEEMEAPAEVDESEDVDAADETEVSDEADADDSSDASDVDVDPSEVTDDDPEADLEPGEDVGRRRKPGDDRDD
ncbi:hypothetical protein [Natronorubrum sp. FCH18a]|uniref:hypothetical protein n=1 Tax=Natronorubrum sp. FCH18a TaxID=3447018 RepID=UPI003F51593E